MLKGVRSPSSRWRSRSRKDTPSGKIGFDQQARPHSNKRKWLQCLPVAIWVARWNVQSDASFGPIINRLSCVQNLFESWTGPNLWGHLAWARDR